MGAYLNAIDILVVPSLETYFWKEQYGRVAAEALACGKKIIYSNTGHLPCLIGENGISFNEGDFNKLSEIITNEINNKDIQDDLEIIRASYSQDNLSAEIQADEMIEMF
jgi:glycosyltransferase involved in cell wall biosynthesis